MGPVQRKIKKKLTCHYACDKHTHVGTQRASPEQAQGPVRFSEKKKIILQRNDLANTALLIMFKISKLHLAHLQSWHCLKDFIFMEAPAQGYKQSQ